MSVIPRTVSEMIAWCQQRAPVWLGNANLIGLRSEQAQAVVDASTAANAALSAQQDAIAAARNATGVLREDARDLRRVAVDAVRLIRIFAESQSKPAQVYQLAQIPPPAQPSPMPPPGMPRDFTVGLDAEGTLTVRWKCTNPPGAQGTVYMLHRRLNAGGSYEFVGATGIKKFIDGEIPTGTWQLDYRVQAQRAGSTGPVAIWTVRFGSGGGGGFVITEQFAGTEDAKLAA